MKIASGLFGVAIGEKLTNLRKVELDSLCNDGSKAVVYFDTDIAFEDADGVIINLEGGGECNYVDECHQRCDNGNRLCKARTQPTLQMKNGIWSKEQENPFANFFKIFHPYCSSDIHQGDSGPSDETGGFHFQGKNILQNVLDTLKDSYPLDKTPAFVMTGCSAGGKGVAGNCDRVGDYLTNLNPDINYKCVADASGWIPLPLKNTPNCDNDQREKDSTKLWNRSINEECQAAAADTGKDPVADCSFETQYAHFHKHPIMFVGSMQDTIFIERHTCVDYNHIAPWELSLWLNHMDRTTQQYFHQNPEVSIFLSPCPGHCTLGGFNQEKVDGMTPIDAMKLFVFDNVPTHIIPSLQHSYPQCPNAWCKAIDRRTPCGDASMSEQQCVSVGCAWCPSKNADQNCIHIVM